MIIKIIITVLGTILTIYIIPLLKAQVQSSQYVYLLQVVDTAVRAVEQTMQNDHNGEYKKQMVTKFVTNWLNEHHIKITQEQLSQIIEWAVFTMKQEDTNGN
jgi:LL-H family phage holin